MPSPPTSIEPRRTSPRGCAPDAARPRSPACCGRPTSSAGRTGPGWALVGDAGYHRDAITGHGLSDAYRDAELLAVALDQALRGDTEERTALAGYQRQRDEALRDIFDLTCAMAGYPPVAEFVDLQKRLSVAIDVEAADRLPATPVPGNREHALA